jgi:1-deoxy-D-xylulose-5-phosphate reductoisomerase
VDSEHSAIYQCLAGGNKIKKLLLTASGGPFFGKTYEELLKVDLKKTLAHPTWSMGAKITVDSATLANKGFEVIEACHLFDVSPDEITVVVHRESIIHSMVEFEDNCVIAELSIPDMRECIQYALTYPERKPSKTEALDFYTLSSLTFHRPDTKTFPLLYAIIPQEQKLVLMELCIISIYANPGEFGRVKPGFSFAINSTVIFSQ